VSDRPKQDLREISHLFLSGLREKQTGGARPQRIGPGARVDQRVEITPEEMARVTDATGPASRRSCAASVTAVLAGHFEERQSERVRQLAANAALTAGRVGLIEVESHDLRLWIYERSIDGTASVGNALPPAEPLDVRRVAESFEELSCDVDQWFICFGQGARATESRDLLRRAGGFVLLSSCEPDGIVAAYRTLKGTSDIVQRDARPPLSLALFDANDAAHASGTFEKINGVAMQFLNWHATAETVIDPNASVDEHLVFNCRSCTEKSQTAAAPQWELLNGLFDRLSNRPDDEVEPPAKGPLAGGTVPVAPESAPSATPVTARITHAAGSASAPHRPPAIKMNQMPQDDAEEIVELPGGGDAASVLSAVIAGSPQQWLECPIRAPMYDEARLVVSRDRVLTLLAVASKGLSELRSIGQAYQWLSQNRSLISMALPQLAIDSHQLPRLQLLVDYADASAEMLQPMLHTGHVCVTAYRKVRFSGRRGLLLEAA